MKCTSEGKLQQCLAKIINVYERSIDVINPFLANSIILYLLKTPENFKFFGVFGGFEMGTWARNMLNNSEVLLQTVKGSFM